MGKATLAAVLLGTLIGTSVFVKVQWTIQPSIAQTINNYRVLFHQVPESSIDEAKPLTLLEAWDVTWEYAQSWSSDSSLIILTSADVDDPDQTPRNDGRRRVWQAFYTSPSLDKELHLQIVDGKVTSAIEDGAYDPAIPTITEKPQVDSPTALKSVQAVIPGFSFSVGRGRGFHFGLHADTNGKPIITVVGSSSSRDGGQVPITAKLDVATGEVLDTQNLSK